MAWIAETKKTTGVTFDLKHLPAYSPNLNLIERLWKFLRKEALQKWHPTFEAMQKAVAEVLDNLPGYHEQLKTLMTERFHLTPTVSNYCGWRWPIGQVNDLINATQFSSSGSHYWIRRSRLRP